MNYQRARIQNLRHTLRGFTPLGAFRYRYHKPAAVVGLALIGDRPNCDVEPLKLELYAGQSSRVYRLTFDKWPALPVLVVPVPSIELPVGGFIVVEWKGRARELHLFHFEKPEPKADPRQLSFAD